MAVMIEWSVHFPSCLFRR